MLFVKLFLTLGSAFAADTYDLKCDFSYAGFPTASLMFSIDGDGVPSSSVTVNQSGAVHKETLTGETKADGEYFHGWLSKESKDNSIELIVYTQKQDLGNGVMINHHVPFGQDMWGNCTGL